MALHEGDCGNAQKEANSPDEVVVVVDDDEAVRDLMAAILSKSGRGIFFFASASAALEHMKVNGVDVLLSDVNMEGTGGLELMCRVKEAFPTVRCIILSANPDNAEKAMQCGADAFLDKPFYPSHLLRIMNVVSCKRDVCGF